MKLEQTWYSLTSDNKWQVDKQIVNMELKKCFISALSNVEIIIGRWFEQSTGDQKCVLTLAKEIKATWRQLW